MRETVPFLDKELVRILWKEGLYRKLLNYVVTTVQYHRRSTFAWGYPYELFIDTNSRCSLRCPFCAVGARTYTKPMLDMPLESFKKAIDELGPYLLIASLHARGEPLMNKDIYEMIAYCNSYRIFTRISSNMQFLDEERAEKMVKSGLNVLMASIDGASQESYETYRRGGRLDLALENVRHVVEAKKRLKRKNPIVEWKFIVFSHNEHEIETAKRMAADLGVDRLSFTSAVVGDAPLKPEQEKWLPMNKEYRMYAAGGANLEKGVTVRELTAACNLPWMSLTIDPESNVQTCCRPIHAKHDHGRISRGFFWKVWNGKRYRDSRNYITNSCSEEGDPTNLCSKCPVKSSMNTFIPFDFYRSI